MTNERKPTSGEAQAKVKKTASENKCVNNQVTLFVSDATCHNTSNKKNTSTMLFSFMCLCLQASMPSG